MRPLAVDLFTGLHGWSDGLVAEGFEAVGVDLEDMSAQFGQPKPDNFHLVIQDVLTLHGSQFRQAALIVASPPCTEFSWMAMPWSRAKQVARALRGEDDFPNGYTGSRTVEQLTALFDACFRIQREAIEAAGHHIPLIVENVRGAQPWVGQARWNFGSYYLYGQVPALMPVTFKGFKSSGMNWSDQSLLGQDFTRIAGHQAMEYGMKNTGGSWFAVGPRGEAGHLNNARDALVESGIKIGSDWFGEGDDRSPMRQHSSKSSARKAASAMIAKIPEPLSRWVARCYYRMELEGAQ